MREHSGSSERQRMIIEDCSTVATTGRSEMVASEQWCKVLTDGHAPLVKARRVFRYLPSPSLQGMQ